MKIDLDDAKEANEWETGKEANAEIQNILKILGLSPGKQCDSVKSLHYGSVMIMSDQDFYGSHMKGLLINMV